MSLTENTEMEGENTRTLPENICAYANIFRQHYLPLSVPSVSSVRKNLAFTLIELMIVMVVISILVGITIPISKYVVLRTRMANQRIYIEKIRSALEDYRAAYGEYPITPVTNADGQVINDADTVRHYPASYATECYYTGNSPYTNVNLTTNTVELLTDLSRQIDYCLTYPLMLRQRETGARPFMDFKEVIIDYFVYKPKLYDAGGDTYENKIRIKTQYGLKPVTIKGIRGNPIYRPKAIDPVSRNQWKYTSEDGLTYNLATNTF